jgi:hypothetical protein
MAQKKSSFRFMDGNEKGKESVLSNGYNLVSQRYVIQWSALNIYRCFNGFLKNPIVRVIK